MGDGFVGAGGGCGSEEACCAVGDTDTMRRKNLWCAYDAPWVVLGAVRAHPSKSGVIYIWLGRESKTRRQNSPDAQEGYTDVADRSFCNVIEVSTIFADRYAPSISIYSSISSNIFFTVIALLVIRDKQSTNFQ